MTKIKLTTLENQVLENLYMSAEGNGHDFGFIEDHGIDPKQARGVISSLIKKNVIEVWDPLRVEPGASVQFNWKSKQPHEINCIEDVLS